MELLLLLIIFMLVFWWDSLETFSQEKKDMDFMRSLQRFLNQNTQYPEYLIFLLKHNNKHKQLSTVETFTILQQLKVVGELSFENIMKFME